ncbi:MAG: 50S ribosomal protein L11 methyltransferase [Xanthomonadales bacterium]|nr:50S ribosomal protein L11 methyltransferase [Xanthomonadales bacterium]
MPWTEVMIRVDRDAVTEAERCLEALGAAAVTLEDDADHPVLEPGPGETPLWPTVSVRGLFGAAVDRAGVLEALRAVPGAREPGRVHWRSLDDRDWVRAWMDRFEPMRFGAHLWVVPSGMDDPADPAAVLLRLDPGLAFGTGTHPTTALCLEWLADRDMIGASVLDYGCGSGILAIAAAKLGASRVVAVDNDPQALEATRLNAERNGVADRVGCVAPEAFEAGKFDVVVANILARPLIELAPLIVSNAIREGRLVLSGLLEEQVGTVTAAYRPHCRVEETATREGWSRVVLAKTA